MMATSRWRMDRRHIENRFSAISSVLLSDYRKICWDEAESHANTGDVSKIKAANFENSKWRATAIWKTFLLLYNYLSRESSDFDEIWCPNANFDSEDGHMIKEKSNFTIPSFKEDPDEPFVSAQEVIPNIPITGSGFKHWFCHCPSK